MPRRASDEANNRLLLWSVPCACTRGRAHDTRTDGRSTSDRRWLLTVIMVRLPIASLPVALAVRLSGTRWSSWRSCS